MFTDLLGINLSSNIETHTGHCIEVLAFNDPSHITMLLCFCGKVF